MFKKYREILEGRQAQEEGYLVDSALNRGLPEQISI
jgi:hypothetical protein